MPLKFLITIITAALMLLPHEGFSQNDPSKAAHMNVISLAFNAGETIPDTYTCKGQNMSPSLTWDGVPEGAQSFALIMDDPDAPSGLYTHWIAYNIPATSRTFSANFSAQNNGHIMMQGLNDSGRTGYTGPCPPAGSGPHRYFFRIFALNATFNLPFGASRAALEQAMTGHIIAQGELMGRYEAPR
jgi:Raf kinase inhibitor-like YbhB/YbcL family protein